MCPSGSPGVDPILLSMNAQNHSTQTQHSALVNPFSHAFNHLKISFSLRKNLQRCVGAVQSPTSLLYTSKMCYSTFLCSKMNSTSLGRLQYLMERFSVVELSSISLVSHPISTCGSYARFVVWTILFAYHRMAGLMWAILSKILFNRSQIQSWSNLCVYLDVTGDCSSLCLL